MYKTLGATERDEQMRRVYFVGYCNSCRGKTFLCQEEFEKLLDYAGWDASRYSLWHILAKKLKLPKIRFVIEREGE